MSNYFFSFKEWYEQIEGSSIHLDSINRSVTVLNEQGEIVGKAKFAKELPSEIGVDELLKNPSKVASQNYFVMLHGYNDENYLYRKETEVLW